MKQLDLHISLPVRGRYKTIRLVTLSNYYKGEVAGFEYSEQYRCTRYAADLLTFVVYLLLLQLVAVITLFTIASPLYVVMSNAECR